MDLVGAGAGGELDEGSGAGVLGGEVGGLDGELAEGVGVGEDGDGVEEAVDVEGAVELVVVLGWGGGR